jgi:hypothetical protein
VVLTLENLDIMLQSFQLQLFLHFDERGLVSLKQVYSCCVFSHLCVSGIKAIASRLEKFNLAPLKRMVMLRLIDLFVKFSQVDLGRTEIPNHMAVQFLNSINDVF